MLKREQQQDPSHFKDLLEAVLPRLEQLNESALSLFADTGALEGGQLARVVYGYESGRSR